MLFISTGVSGVAATRTLGRKATNRIVMCEVLSGKGKNKLEC